MMAPDAPRGSPCGIWRGRPARGTLGSRCIMDENETGAPCGACSGGAPKPAACAGGWAAAGALGLGGVAVLMAPDGLGALGCGRAGARCMSLYDTVGITAACCGRGAMPALGRPVMSP